VGIRISIGLGQVGVGNEEEVRVLLVALHNSWIGRSRVVESLERVGPGNEKEAGSMVPGFATFLEDHQ